MDLKLISKLIAYSLISALTLSFASCNSDSEISVIGEESSDAQIKSFSIDAVRANAVDSLVHPLAMKTTKFTIDNSSGYRIFNIDSLPQHTEIGTIHAKIGFGGDSRPYRRIDLVYKDKSGQDSIPETSWAETDSVKFYKTEIGYIPRINVVAPNGYERRYTVEFNIHKSDPDSIRWEEVKNFDLLKKGDNKTIISTDSTKFYSLTNDGTKVHFYTSNISEKTPSWDNVQTTNLPTNAILKSLKIVGDCFILIDSDGSSYTSNIATPANWTKHENYKALALLEILPKIKGQTEDELLIIYTNERNNNVFAKFKIANIDSKPTELKIVGRKENNNIPEDFPIKDFSTHLGVKIGAENIIVTAGKYAGNKINKKSWLIDNVAADEINVINGYSDPVAEYDKGGVATFIYNNQLYALANDSLYTSRSFGDRWVKANKKQALSKKMTNRHMPSIIVDKNDYVWVFGGKSTNNEYLQGVWRGRLNKLAFLQKK